MSITDLPSRFLPLIVFFFFFNDTATTEIYTLSLHDALPNSHSASNSRRLRGSRRASMPSISTRRKRDRKSTRLNSSHVRISYAVFCLKKKKTQVKQTEQYQKKADTE